MWPASVDDISELHPTRRLDRGADGALLPSTSSVARAAVHLDPGSDKGESRIVVKRVKEGLKPGLPTEIAAIPAGAAPLAEFGKSLDQAWLTYMKDRPRTARGYSENPAGKMFDGIKGHMIGQEEALAAQAAAGTLLAPGRQPGERAPYLKH
jgi:hypothetical protein